MKKFLKAVALATVMCMLLSVSAFAAATTVDGVGTYEEGETATITIIGSGTEQVALLVVAADATTTAADLANIKDTQIKYIGQEAVNGNSATFTVKVDQGMSVDIYAGAASFNGSAKQLANDLTLYPNSKLTIVENVVHWAKATGAGEDKSGVAAAVNLTLPEGVSVSKMIWAFTVEGEEFKRYSETIENPTAGVIEGATQFAVSYMNGSVKAGIDTLEVTGVDVIILDNNDVEYFTDNDDAQREDSVVNPAN